MLSQEIADTWLLFLVANAAHRSYNRVLLWLEGYLVDIVVRWHFDILLDILWEVNSDFNWALTGHRRLDDRRAVDLLLGQDGFIYYWQLILLFLSRFGFGLALFNKLAWLILRDNLDALTGLLLVSVRDSI